MFLLKQLTRPTSNEESGSSNRKWRSAWCTCSKRFIILIQRLSWQKQNLLKAFPVSQPKTWKYLVWNIHLGEHVIEGILCKFRGLSPFKHSINSEAFLWSWIPRCTWLIHLIGLYFTSLRVVVAFMVLLMKAYSL